MVLLRIAIFTQQYLIDFKVKIIHKQAKIKKKKKNEKGF